MQETSKTESEIKNNKSQHFEGSSWCSQLTLETGLGFASHQQGIWTSAKTLTLFPSSCLVSQEVKAFIAFVLAPSVPGAMFQSYESAPAYYI